MTSSASAEQPHAQDPDLDASAATLPPRSRKRSIKAAVCDDDAYDGDTGNGEDNAYDDGGDEDYEQDEADNDEEDEESDFDEE